MNEQDYLDTDRFPLTTQPGLSLREQMRIDAFNLDSLREYRDEGNALDAEQQALLAELEEKARHRPRLLRELSAAEGRGRAGAG